MMTKQVFGTGLARSGGGLYSMLLSAHPDMMVACCPNLELFRSFRNTVVTHCADDGLKSRWNPSAALQDYYGTHDRIRLLDLMLDADLDLPFDSDQWPRFYEKSVARGNLESGDLTSHYQRLKSGTYREMVTHLLEIIMNARGGHERQWVGFHEAWVLDAFPALARVYPQAHFLIMFRDPRAIVHSLIGVGRHIDPSQFVQTLSYLRHWRKYAALAFCFSKDPLFRGRLHITAHDLVLLRTRPTVEALCAFFGLELDERMLDTENYYDFTTKTTWKGNSSFEKKTSGISAHRALRWKENLDPVVIRAVEYICGPEMKLVGYPTYTPFADIHADADDKLTEYLLSDVSGYSNWRSDLEDPLLDLGLEAVRRQLLRLSLASNDTALVRRTFLFKEVYTELREGASPLIPAFREIA